MSLSILVLGVAAIGVVAVLVVVISVLLIRRRAVTVPAPTPAPPQRAAPSEPPPMNGLDSALAQVTDSTGRPIRDRIDAETEHVDELRVVDDTGPLLRRALDHVVKPPGDADPNPAGGSGGAAGTDAPPAE